MVDDILQKRRSLNHALMEMCCYYETLPDHSIICPLLSFHKSQGDLSTLVLELRILSTCVNLLVSVLLFEAVVCEEHLNSTQLV